MDIISIAPSVEVPALVTASDTFISRGRERNASTPQPKSQYKDAFLAGIPPLHERRMGYHFASLIVHTADTSRACARQASRNRRT